MTLTADDSRSAWRDDDRLTYDDRAAMTAAVVLAVDLDRPRPALDGFEHGRLARLAAASIACTLDDLRCSELHWLAGMITLVSGLADMNDPDDLTTLQLTAQADDADLAAARLAAGDR